MGSVYIYEADETDFSTIGICGALTPTICKYHEVANGDALWLTDTANASGCGSRRLANRLSERI